MRGLRLLVADLVVFDRHRLAWRLATRTLLAFLLPLVAAQILGRPALVYMALGGFLTAIGDSVDDGDRRQFLRLAVCTLVGAAAAACGVLAGGGLAVALAGTLLWCLFAGLLGVYGNAFAVVGLPIAWAYVEIGLPAHRHDLAFAATVAGAWLAGGVLTALLTRLTTIGGAHAPLVERCAECYRALARYLEALRHMPDAAAVVPPETPVRAAIGEARRLADERRVSTGAAGRRAARQQALIDIADRLFSQAARLHEHGAPASPELAGAVGSLAAVSHDVARAVAGTSPDRVDTLLTRLRQVENDASHVAAREAARLLAEALRIIRGDGDLPGDPAAAAANDPGRSAAVLAPLRACLDWQSIVTRHALRFALVTCAAVGVFWVFPPPFGYWVPLTVTTILKPYAGVTVARAVQRVAGTVAGVLLGSVLLPLLPGMAAQIAATGVAFFCLMLVLPFNYSLAIFFLSLGIVPFEHALMPHLDLDVGSMRLVATAIGAALALVGGHLLWPSFERRELPALLQRSLRSAAAYAAAALGGTGLGEARRRAGMDTTNFHTSCQRSLTEVGLSPQLHDTVVVAAAALQRLMLANNDLALDRRLAGPAAAEAEALLRRLAEGQMDGREASSALRRLAAEPADRTLDRIGVEIGVLTTCLEEGR